MNIDQLRKQVEPDIAHAAHAGGVGDATNLNLMSHVCFALNCSRQYNFGYSSFPHRLTFAYLNRT